MKKVIPILIALVLIIGVGAAWVVSILIERKTPTDDRMDSAVYYNMTEEDQVALIINGTINDSFGKKIDGTVFIDYHTVSDYINKRFYWDVNEQLMLYALPTEVIKVDLKTENADYRMIDDTLYISMNAIMQYTEMDCQVFDSPDRVVIRNEWDDVQVAYAQTDSHVRYRGGIKSEILTDVANGAEIQVLDAESFENWAQVATSDGYIGYIEKADLSDVQEKTYDYVNQGTGYTSISRDHKINMVWHQVTNQSANNNVGELLDTTSGVNVVAPTWFFIDDINGSMVNLSSSDYVAEAHARGIEVWAVINDFDGSMASKDSTYAVLSKTSAREKIITEVVNSVLACGADGINVDIEKVSESCATHYLQFIRELSVQCRNNGLVLSIDNYVPTYSAYFDREEQGIVADYVIIMGYDEHYAGSEETGSVASISFVEDGIKRTLEEVPAEKVINAIPFYTRIWTTDSNGQITSEACAMSVAEDFLTTNGLSKYWDNEAGQNYAEMHKDDSFYQVWMEDAQSVAEKMKLIQSYDLAGVSAWKLGFETQDIWGVINQYLQ